MISTHCETFKAADGGEYVCSPFLSQVMNKLETRPEKTMCKELIAYEKGEYSWSLDNANFTTVIFNNAILILLLWKLFTKV